MTCKGRHAALGLTGAALIITGIILLPMLINVSLKYIVLQIMTICPCSTLYKSWKEPSSSVPLYQSFYLFHLENPGAVLAGAKPVVVEKGPYVYNLTMFRNAESWNLNHTVTYTQPITYRFVRNMSVTSDDEVITTINFPFIRNGTSNGLYTAFTGVGDPDRVAHIEYWNGSNQLDYWHSKWANMINGTDGTMFHPFIDKSETLYTFNPNMCRSMPYTYKEDTSFLGIPLLKYYISPNVFANTTVYPPNEEFCQSNCRFSGVFNTSRCSKGAPLGLSNPHFLNGSKELQESVVGLKPNVSLHESNFQIEPVMGLPYKVAERLQINMFIESVYFIPQTGSVKPFYYPFLWFEEKVTVREEDALKYKNSVLKINVVVFWLKVILPTTGGSMIVLLAMLLARKWSFREGTCTTKITTKTCEVIVSKTDDEHSSSASANNMNDTSALLPEF